MKSKYDSPLIGLAIGLIVPLLALVLFYFFMVKTLSFPDFILQTWRMHRLPQVFSICVATNLAGFFLFIQKGFYFSARGVIIATFLYTLGVLVMKYIL
jgi:hypothetical protein